MKLKNSQFYDILFKFGIFAFVVNLFWVTLKRQARNVERVNHGEGRLKAGQTFLRKHECFEPSKRSQRSFLNKIDFPFQCSRILNSFSLQKCYLLDA